MQASVTLPRSRWDHPEPITPYGSYDESVLNLDDGFPRASILTKPFIDGARQISRAFWQTVTPGKPTPAFVKGVEDCFDKFHHLCDTLDPALSLIATTLAALADAIHAPSCPVLLQSAWILKVADLPCVTDCAATHAEHLINTVKDQISNTHDYVRAFAVTVIRSLTQRLDPRGPHLCAQLTIICNKNLTATLQDCIRSTKYPLSQLACMQAITAINVHWLTVSPVLPKNASTSAPYAINAIRVAFSLLLAPALNDSMLLLRWTAADCLLQITTAVGFIPGLDDLEACSIVTESIKCIRSYRQGRLDAVALAYVVRAFDTAESVEMLLKHAALLSELLSALLTLLPPLTVTHTTYMKLRVAALCVLARIIVAVRQTRGPGVQQLGTDADWIKVLEDGCLSEPQLQQLHEVVSKTCTAVAGSLHMELVVPAVRGFFNEMETQGRAGQPLEFHVSALQLPDAVAE
eukprot:TRINITY_DN3109_c0_g1_i1.p1 TRINITY_DN3109_c0_g1~~TRINITY_DN3109_c0_g1_i1.p1  ORF type:complete len:463 (-),score=89.87 TRINITY_DN3109_c0_g1_i1:1139-2527(-)